MGLRVALALGVLAAAAGIAVADPAAEAKAHREQGLRRYNTQDYEGAIKEWREAYVLAPDPDTLFAIGQAQRLMGDCKAAVVTYRSALRDVSSGKQRVEIEQVIKVCEDKLAAEPPKPEAQPVTPSEAQAKPVVLTIRKPWFRDPLGLTLLVLGTGGVAVGGTFFVLGRGAESDADAATSYEGFAAAADRAKRDRMIATIGGAAGGALLVGAVIRFVTRSDTIVVTATAGTDGTGLSFAGRF